MYPVPLHAIPADDRLVLVGNSFFSRRYHDLRASNWRPPAHSAVLFLGLHRRARRWRSRHFLWLFAQLQRHPRCRYAVVVQKTDPAPRRALLRLAPPNLVALYMTSSVPPGTVLHNIPMGLNAAAIDALDTIRVTTDQRPILCYSNFGLRTDADRTTVFEALRDKPFVTSDVFARETPLSNEEYYRRLSRAKFAPCPRGWAEQTFRFWECLYLGTIPIVVRQAYHTDLGEDLPILFLDSVRDYATLTQSFLEDKYVELMARPRNHAKLRLSYWLDRIDTDFAASLRR